MLTAVTFLFRPPLVDWYQNVLLREDNAHGCTTTTRTTLTLRPVITARAAMVWYGMVSVYSAIVTKVSSALNTLVPREKPGFQALSKGLVVLLCAEVVQQRVPDHGAVHGECSATDSG